MKTAIYRADGQLTAYGLACGYVQTNKERHTTDGAVYMYREHNVYHVRIFGREVWESFDTLPEARERYAELVKYPDGYNGYNSWDDWNVCLHVGDTEHEYKCIREQYAEQYERALKRSTIADTSLPAGLADNQITRAQVRRAAINRTANYFYVRRYKGERTPDGVRYTEKRLRLAVEHICEDL